MKVIDIDKKTIQHYQGKCYIFDLPEHNNLSDNSINSNRSPLLIFEDGNLLTPKHASHSDIINLGDGRYSHWDSSVLFSSSDNSNPILNNRSYTYALVTPPKLTDRDISILAEGIVELSKSGGIFSTAKKLLQYTEDTQFHYYDPLFELKEYMLAELLRQQSSAYGGSVAVVRSFNIIRWWLNRLNIDVKDKSILEVGPGRSAALGLLLLMARVRDYIGIDAFASDEWWHNTMLESVIRICKEFYPELDVARGKQIIRSSAFEKESPDFPLRYAITQDGKYPCPDNSVDVIFSFSVFEHIDFPDAALKELHRVLRPGGIMIHSIDLATHEPFKPSAEPYNPFSFLRYSDQEWESKWKPDTMKYYQNRWRKPHFLQAFQAAGFENIEALSEKDIPVNLVNEEVFQPKIDAYKGITPAMKSEFSSRFQQFSDDDLAPMTLLLASRKPLK